MISNACTRRVIGSGAAGGRSGESAQFALICGVIDDVIHVSMTSGSPVNAVPPHFAQRVDRRRALERVDGQLLFGGEHGLAALFAEPDREGHAVEALTRDVPVVLQALDPTVEAHLHVVGMPRELRAAREQLVGEVEDAHEPVRPHLELDRALRALGHRHLLLDLLRAAERAGGFEVGDDPFARRVDVEAGVLAGDVGQLARGVDAEPQREAVALPALHVGAVAEGAHHHEPGTELGANLLVGEDGHFVAGDRDDRVLIGE